MNSSIKKTFWFAVAPILTPAISFISLPILTLQLGAADYGLFGLGIVLSSLIAGVGGFGVLLYLGGQQLSVEQRRDGVMVAVIGAVLGALVIAIFVVLVWWGASIWFPDVVPIEAKMMAFIVVIGLCGAFNAVASEAMIHFGSARAYSICAIAQALIFALTAIVCMFYWRADTMALYAAGAAGAIAQTILSLISVRRHLHGNLSRDTIVALWNVAKPTLVATYLEHLKTLTERWLINFLIGLHVLGLFFHSQQYRSAMNSVIKIPIKGLWQTALTEAASAQPTFSRLRPIWGWIDNLVFMGGISFILVGGELIGLLTHGKFSNAAPFAAIWMAITLMETAGRPYVLLIIARGSAVKLGRILLITNLAMLIGTPLALLAFGIWGVFVAVGLSAILNWALSRREAKRILEIQLPDSRPIGLAMIILIGLATNYYFQPTLDVRLGTFVVIVVGFVVAALRNGAIMSLLKMLPGRQRTEI